MAPRPPAARPRERLAVRCTGDGALRHRLGLWGRRFGGGYVAGEREERLSPDPAERALDGLLAQDEGEQGRVAARPEEEPAGRLGHRVEPRGVALHPRPPGPQVTDGVGRERPVRPTGEEDQQLYRRLDERRPGSRAQCDAAGAFGHADQAVGSLPPVVAQERPHLATITVMSADGRTVSRPFLARWYRGRRHSSARFAPTRNQDPTRCLAAGRVSGTG